MQIRHAIILLAALTLGSLFPTVAHAQEKKPIRIGVLGTFAGTYARFGELMRSGIEAGAAPGVQFVYEDEACAPAQAVNAFQKLATLDQISIFIGPLCGSSQQAIAPLLKNKERIAIFANSAPRALFSESGHRAFSAQYSIENESAFNAGAISAFGYKRAVIFASATEFSRAHDLAFRAHFKGDVVESILLPSADKESIRAAALTIKTLNPDALYVPDVTPFLFGLRTHLRQTGLGALPVFSVYSAQSADVLTAEGSSADGLMYSFPDIGEADAFNYFSKTASEIITKAAVSCGGDVECVKELLEESDKFDAEGTLQGKIVLKRVENGTFGKVVPLPPTPPL